MAFATRSLNIASDAIYTAGGGNPVLVRVVERRGDSITGFGEAKLWSETLRFDLRVSEVANPRPGDRLEIGGEAFLIQGEPTRGFWRASAPSPLPCARRAVI